MKLNLLIILLIAALSSLRSNVSAQCAAIDQSQLNYNGGMSARNLAQYSEWQYFTSGVTGTLCQLDIGFFNYMNGNGIFKVFEGTGTGGALLQSDNVTVSGTGNFFQTFFVSVPVVSGSVYTFQFIPIQGGGLTDPYGVQIHSPGTYADGEMYITDPSGTYATGFDMVFKTYVTLATGISIASSFSPAISVFPNPASDILTVISDNTNSITSVVTIYNYAGQKLHAEVLQNNQQQIDVSDLCNGIYIVEITAKEGTEKQKLIIQR